MSSAKSFYIFDFDDNIINTGSLTFLYHKDSGAEVAVTTTDYVKHRADVGKKGVYKDYFVDPALMRSYRSFHDSAEHNHFPFIQDLERATSEPGWEGPSWQRFLKAIHRKRTMAIVTARGHHPDEITRGLQWLVEQKLLPYSPEIHQIYAVTHQRTRDLLKWTGDDDISAMKKQALNHFIESVYESFGYRPAHRFGFSDDDPANIASTRVKFLDMKKRNPHHSFFLYKAGPKKVVEEEILLTQYETQ